MWFVFCYSDSSFKYFENKEDATVYYNKLLNTLKLSFKDDNWYESMESEMIVISKVIKAVKFNENAKDGIKIIK